LRRRLRDVSWRNQRFGRAETELQRATESANKERRSRNMKIVMVLTSHDQLGNTGRKTGF
jgi:hypothetical protein